MKMITLEEIDRYIAENEQDESAHLRSAASYCDEVIDYFYNPKQRVGVPLPWQKTRGNFDLRPNEVTLWLGYNGHGKSLILGQIANSIMADGERVCVASLEMKPISTLARMCRQASGGSEPSIHFIKAYHEWTDGRLWIYDQNGSVPPDRICNMARFAQAQGCSHIIIDSLMKVIDREDDYNAQKQFVNQLCILARDTGLHIHLVHHSRKGEDENKQPGKMDAKGSGSITDLVDNCVSVWRPKEKKAGSWDCIVKVDKQRHGEWEGKFGFYFHPESQSYCEDEKLKPPSVQIGREESF